MKKLLILLLLSATFSSCGTYNISTSYKIKSILTITEKGDTLAVPIRDFKFRILRQEDPFRYQYRQDWQHGNWNNYYVPNINVRDVYSPPVMHTRPIIVPPTRPVVKPIIKSIKSPVKIKQSPNLKKN